MRNAMRSTVHTGKNIGKTEMKSLIIELKKIASTPETQGVVK